MQHRARSSHHNGNPPAVCEYALQEHPPAIPHKVPEHACDERYVHPEQSSDHDQCLHIRLTYGSCNQSLYADSMDKHHEPELHATLRCWHLHHSGR